MVPVVGLAQRAGLHRLIEEHLTIPTDKGAHAVVKVTAHVGGMVFGADSIEDLNLLRHAAMSRLFTGIHAPSTLGSFLPALAFGQVRQLDAVAARPDVGPAAHTPLLRDASRSPTRCIRG